MSENMKPSGINWIGDVPESWQVSKIKFGFAVVNGSTPDSSDYDCWVGKIKWITPADMNETGIIDSGDRSITEFGYNSCGTTLLPKGSIVISSRAPIGKINITTEVLCTNQGCKGLVAKRDNKFTYYLMLAGHNELTLLGRGTTFLELSTYDLTNFKIVIPSLHEQTLIADFLDEQCERIDSIVSDLKKQIDILYKYKKSLITETVTRGLDKSVSMKHSRIEWIGVIPEHWIESKIKFKFSVINGSTPESSDYDCWDGNIKWITPADMNETGIVDRGSRTITDYGYNSCGTTMLPKGSIVISSRAPIGKINITSEQLCTNQGCKSLVSRKDNRFFYYLLLAGHNELVLLGRGTTFLELSTYDLSGFKIVIPSEAEQTQIADFLDKQCSKIDSLIESKREQLTKIMQHKKSLIYEYVTGKKRVKGAHSNGN